MTYSGGPDLDPRPSTRLDFDAGIYLAHEPTDEERTLPWEEGLMGFVAADIMEQKEITPASRLFGGVPRLTA